MKNEKRKVLGSLFKDKSFVALKLETFWKCNWQNIFWKEKLIHAFRDGNAFIWSAFDFHLSENCCCQAQGHLSTLVNSCEVYKPQTQRKQYQLLKCNSCWWCILKMCTMCPLSRSGGQVKVKIAKDCWQELDYVGLKTCIKPSASAECRRTKTMDFPHSTLDIIQRTGPTIIRELSRHPVSINNGLDSEEIFLDSGHRMGSRAGQPRGHEGSELPGSRPDASAEASDWSAKVTWPE